MPDSAVTLRSTVASQTTIATNAYARSSLSRSTTFETKLSPPTPIVNLVSKRYLLEEATMSARETAELLLLVGRLVQAEGYDGELSPAQWMALRYFARANRFSRNPSAFAEFQATTRGTASQAIKALEASGYLVRQRSKADGRSVSLRLTSKGKKRLHAIRSKFWCAPWICSTRKSKPRCTTPCTKC